MPADAPRATAEDRLPPGNGSGGEAAPGDSDATGDPALGAPPPGPSAPADTGTDIGNRGHAGAPPAARTRASSFESTGDSELDALLADGRGDTIGSSSSGAGTPGVGRLGPAPSHVTSSGTVADAPAVGWADPVPGSMTSPPGDPVRPAPVGPATGGGVAGRRSRRAQRRGVRVRQRLWSIDPWSVFKVSVLFYFCLFLILMVAGTLLWNVARSSGTIDEAESFVTRLGAYGRCIPEDDVADGQEFESDDDCPDGEVLVDGFALDDGTVFKAAAMGGLVLAVTGSAGNVLLTVLLNLINEVTGGARYTIIKERDQRSRQRPSGGGGPPRGSLLARRKR
ncbi:MAG TPA: DUF3566 domain-containing protein [Acidimicrobiales bacterium]|nr:DUF3566 domain-containing protein [Acidimicrobiales bacterium]